MGLFSSSKSSSSSSTTNNTTNNTDERIVTGEGGGSVNADGNAVVTQNITSVAPEVVDSALSFAAEANANSGNALAATLDTSKGIIDNATAAISSAYSQAAVDAKGSLEQKTIIIIAIALASVAAIWAYRRA